MNSPVESIKLHKEVGLLTEEKVECFNCKGTNRAINKRREMILFNTIERVKNTMEFFTIFSKF